MVGPKKQDFFLSKSQNMYSQRRPLYVVITVNECHFFKKSSFQSRFSVSNFDGFILIWLHYTSVIHIGDHFLLKTITFEPLLFSKILPIFWQTDIYCIHKIQLFSCSLLARKSCFFGPTIFELPQPNWHWYTCCIYR